MSLRHYQRLSSKLRRVSQLCASRAEASTAASSVDSEDVRSFSRLSSEWHDESGPFKALHSLNALRVPWILQNVKEKRGSVVDVGCGGGILSVALARAGLNVTGIDASQEAVTAARSALESRPLKVTGVSERILYHCGTVEDFSKDHEREFDVVVASEIVEHVANLDSFITGCARLAKPGAPLLFTTINKTLASRVLAIWLAENVLNIVPQGIHQWEKFVEPDVLSSILERNGCSVRAIAGFTYNPATNVWSWTPSTAVNYALIAVKS